MGLGIEESNERTFTESHSIVLPDRRIFCGDSEVPRACWLHFEAMSAAGMTPKRSEAARVEMDSGRGRLSSSKGIRVAIAVFGRQTGLSYTCRPVYHSINPLRVQRYDMPS